MNKAYGYRNVTLNGPSRVVSEDKTIANNMIKIVSEANLGNEFQLVTFEKVEMNEKLWKVGQGRAGNNYCVNNKVFRWIEVK